MIQLSDNHGGAIGIVWVDLETTGTDEGVDDIIEIGAIYTDFDLNIIDREFQIVVDPCEYALGRLMKNDIVRKMHTQNGLLEEVLANEGIAIEEAEAKMLLWLHKCVNKNHSRGDVNKFRFMLGGSGVSHFDRRFITHHMPRLDALLTYGPADVGVLRRFLKLYGIAVDPDNTPQKDHRALSDIRLHLEEARAYRDRFRFLFPSGHMNLPSQREPKKPATKVRG